MADVQFEENLISEFGEFGIDISGNLGVLEKLCSLCKIFSLDVENIVAEWCNFAFNSSSGNQEINEDALELFEKQHLLKRDKRNQSAKKTSHSRQTGSFDGEDESSMLGSYAKTPERKDSIKRLHTTPDNDPASKRFATNNLNPTPMSSKFSPASFSSPAIATPSVKYEARNSKGDIVTTHNISDKSGIVWKGSSQKLKICPYDKNNTLTGPYKHMFQKLQDKADVLNDIITHLSTEIKENLMLDDLESVRMQTQDEVVVAGRICCDSVGRMNSKSILLEGSRESSGGERVQLDLSELKNYSVFPGQIVAVQGKNTNGNSIRPSSIYKGCRLPFYSARKKNQTVDDSHFTVYIACGPFATCSDMLSYKPLEDLLQVVKEERPDVLVLLGPFVDSKQSLIEKGEIDQTFDELFKMCCDEISKAIQNLPTNVIMVPSQRDVFHDFVFPQPPFPEIKDQKIHMMSDPCTFLINDVVFGVTSSDILFHLGAEEVSFASNRSDRLGRLADHLLLQQCYYPLHPTHEDVNLDYEHFEEFAFMPISPDLLVVPSDLRYFIKDVEGCLCLNPGRLVKGQTGGTYAKLLVKPKKPNNVNKSSVVEQSVVQVVRI